MIGQFKKVNLFGADYYVDTLMPKGNTIAAEVFDIAGDHGTAVHDAIKFDLTCGVIEEGMHPDVLEALNQFRAWKEEYVDEIFIIEKPLYSVRHGYAGTPDLYCRLKRKYGGKMAVVDFKTGAHGFSGPQTAAYEPLVREETGYRGKIDRFVLLLPKNGTKYKFKPETGSDDFNFFKSRLFQYNFIGR